MAKKKSKSSRGIPSQLSFVSKTFKTRAANHPSIRAAYKVTLGSDARAVLAQSLGFILDKMSRNFDVSRKSKHSTSSVTLDTVRGVVGSTFGFECQPELSKCIDDAVLAYWRSYGNTTADPDKPGQTTNAVLPPGFQARPERNKIVAASKKRGSLAAV
jgi:hypothetical protein